MHICYLRMESLTGILSIGGEILKVKRLYLLYCFADNLFVLVLCDFLPLVKGFDGCLHFIYSSFLDLLFLKQKKGDQIA